MNNATQRFSDRVDNYIKYRPNYPQGVIDCLMEHTGITTESTIVDVGSGTGIFSELLLKNDFKVIGIEPNLEMRLAAERLLQHHQGFKSIDGTAEVTTLPDQQTDLIVATQAFHWFEPATTRKEFKRILTPRGKVALIWNDRKFDAPFGQAYENYLLTHGTDYRKVNHRQIDRKRIERFFEHDQVALHTYYNYQEFDFEGLKGRALSSSYFPNSDSPQFETLMQELRTLFDHHRQNGVVRVEYDTLVFIGQFG